MDFVNARNCNLEIHYAHLPVELRDIENKGGQRIKKKKDEKLQSAANNYIL